MYVLDPLCVVWGRMVAANEIFDKCQEQFVTAVLGLLRPKILILDANIFNRDDMTREVFFLESGEIEVRALHHSPPHALRRWHQCFESCGVPDAPGGWPLLQMYDDDPYVPFRVIRPTENMYTVVGPVAFFLQVPQPYLHKASSKSHVKLLALSKEDYEEIKDRYPESRDQLIANIKSTVGLGLDGEQPALSILSIGMRVLGA
jgi:hypothetical protein